MIVAIIAARGGSKRIIGKNLKPFRGKPMIAWPIEAIFGSGLFDHIIVSTDSAEIAECSRQYGAETPFIRPPELADDFTPSSDVFLHALQWLEQHNIKPTYLCCLYPTAPFLTAAVLQDSFRLLDKSGAPGIIPVTTFDFPILRAFRIDDEGTLQYNWPEYASSRSQDLPELYHDAGQFYWVMAKPFKNSRSLCMPGAKPFLLPRKYVQDLDTPEDWELAELMASAMAFGTT